MHEGNNHGEVPAEDMDHHAVAAPARRGIREKFLIPLAIPVGCAIVIAAIVLSISQILLAVPSNVATVIALVIAVLILLACTFFATARTLNRQMIMAGIAVPAIALLGSGIYAGIYRQNNPTHEAGSGEAANVGSQPATQVTTDNKFSTTAYTVEVNEPIVIPIKNQGTALHNMHILEVKDASGQDIKTDLLPPGAGANLSFTIAQAGSYNFQCDVHPTEMKGTITVVASTTSATAATAATVPGAGGGLSEVTTDNKFSQTSFTVDKGVPAALTVKNKGQALHNWHVLIVKGSDGNDIKTDLVPAGSTATATFQIDQPGTYDFQCDVHPAEMKGKLTIK